MAEHDHSYKLLFSHPRMVEDLLRGFVHEAWVGQVDFATLEKVGGSYVSDDLRERENDVVWRVRWGGNWLYVYILIEFQSTVDRYMAVRLLTYLGLLYQDLIKGKQLSPEGHLPPVLPLVLYNGERSWNAPTDVAELIGEVPAGLEAYRPAFRYLLLDEGAYTEEVLSGLQNLVAAVFRLENSRSPEQVRSVVRLLLEWLHEPEQTPLRRSFTVWLGRVLLPGRLRGVNLPELNDLHEVDAMLAERVKEWTKQWREEGLEQGLEQGREEGLERGRKEGEKQMLLRLLQIKFGALPEAAYERVHAADAERLMTWSERVLTANSLDEVLD